MARNNAVAANDANRTPKTPRRSWLRMGFGFGIGLILAYALSQAVVRAAEILTLVLLALFLAVSLEPIVLALARLHLRRGLAATVIILGFVALLAGFAALVIPPVSTEIDALTKAIPKWLQQLHDHHSQLGKLEDRYHLIDKVKAELSSGGLGSGLASGVLGAGRVIIGAVTATFVVITLTIYFLVGMPAVKRFSLRFVAVDHRRRVEELTDRIIMQVGRFMLTNVATSALAGLATFLWAWGTGIPYAAMLGFLVAILDLVPVVGSTIGGIVVALVGLSVSLAVAIATVVFYIVFRFTEDHLITPIAMRYSIRLHPVATMIAVLIGGTLIGVIGALLAVPAATAVALVLEEVYFPGREAAPPVEADETALDLPAAVPTASRQPSR